MFSDAREQNSIVVKIKRERLRDRLLRERVMFIKPRTDKRRCNLGTRVQFKIISYYVTMCVYEFFDFEHTERRRRSRVKHERVRPV